MPGEPKTDELRNLVIMGYGAKCVCCGDQHREFLAIDHVLADGAAERKRLSRHQIYRSIIANGFPAKYRLLCHNCNMSRAFYGYCPHEREPKP